MPVKEFTCKEDVWEAVDLLIEEIRNANRKGNEFDLVESINAQLPFFACRNIFLDRNIQKDIQRYVYCKDLGISPYEGSYNKHPALWVDKYFVIKKAFSKLEKSQIDKIKRENKNG